MSSNIYFVVCLIVAPQQLQCISRFRVRFIGLVMSSSCYLSHNLESVMDKHSLVRPSNIYRCHLNGNTHVQQNQGLLEVQNMFSMAIVHMLVSLSRCKTGIPHSYQLIMLGQ